MTTNEKYEKMAAGCPEGFVRSVLWGYQFWRFVKAVFWLPLTFIVVSFIEIMELFK